MILCYACNAWKDGEMAPFAICGDCRNGRTAAIRREQEQQHAQQMLALYWHMQPQEQEGICEVAYGSQVRV